jgi:hypothetical protein
MICMYSQVFCVKVGPLLCSKNWSQQHKEKLKCWTQDQCQECEKICYVPLKSIHILSVIENHDFPSMPLVLFCFSLFAIAVRYYAKSPLPVKREITCRITRGCMLEHDTASGVAACWNMTWRLAFASWSMERHRHTRPPGPLWLAWSQQAAGRAAGFGNAGFSFSDSDGMTRLPPRRGRAIRCRKACYNACSAFEALRLPLRFKGACTHICRTCYSLQLSRNPQSSKRLLHASSITIVCV